MKTMYKYGISQSYLKWKSDFDFVLNAIEHFYGMNKILSIIFRAGGAHSIW